MSKPIAPFHGWAVTGEGQRGGWIYWFTLAPTRKRATQIAVRDFLPDKCPDWPSLSKYARLRVIKVTVSAND